MKKSLAVAIILIFLSVSVIPSTGTTVVNKPTISTFHDGNTLYVGGNGTGNYSKIQDAIDNASDGDTVFVYSGVYYENVVVDKSINLIGEDMDTTVIDGSGIGDVVYISADWVNISGFTIQNSVDVGIYVTSDYNNISGNNITINNYIGIRLQSSSNNVVSGNDITKNGDGIVLSDSHNTTIGDNIVISNGADGIHFCTASKNNVIVDNIISDNVARGIQLEDFSDSNIINENVVSNNGLQGIYLHHSSNNNIISNCNIQNNIEGICLDYSSSITFSNNNITTNDWSGISLINSLDNDISGNNIISNDDRGIIFEYSSNNTITKNTISNNWDGIYLGSSNNISISGNIISSNNNYGICLDQHSNDNIIKNNTVSNQGESIRLENCFENIISKNIVTDNEYGVTLLSGGNNTICGNIISSNFFEGISVVDSNNNIIFCNKVTLHGQGGINLWGSSTNNLVYHNNFINNTDKPCDECTNMWDNGYPSGGNYWDDYSGLDNYSGPNQNITGPDGIGDSPYNITGGSNQDRYPLMEPYGMTKLTFSMGPGLFKFSGIIKNIGNKTAFNVQWKITFDGGIILIGRESSGTIQRPLLPGEETSISSRFVLGFGRITITVAVWADNAPKLSGTIEGILLLFFLMIIVGG